MNKNNSLKVVIHAVLLAVWPGISAAETTVLCDPNGSPESIQMSSSGAQSSKCGTYLDEAGQDATFCQWGFPYRSTTARDAFLDAETALDGCFEKTNRVATDVNHPDSYDQVIYASGPKTISLSLKDKAKLQSTYMFLRVETSP